MQNVLFGAPANDRPPREVRRYLRNIPTMPQSNPDADRHAQRVENGFQDLGLTETMRLAMEKKKKLKGLDQRYTQVHQDRNSSTNSTPSSQGQEPRNSKIPSPVAARPSFVNRQQQQQQQSTTKKNKFLWNRDAEDLPPAGSVKAYKERYLANCSSSSPSNSTSTTNFSKDTAKLRSRSNSRRALWTVCGPFLNIFILVSVVFLAFAVGRLGEQCTKDNPKQSLTSAAGARCILSKLELEAQNMRKDYDIDRKLESALEQSRNGYETAMKQIRLSYQKLQEQSMLHWEAALASPTWQQLSLATRTAWTSATRTGAQWHVQTRSLLLGPTVQDCLSDEDPQSMQQKLPLIPMEQVIRFDEKKHDAILLRKFVYELQAQPEKNRWKKKKSNDVDPAVTVEALAHSLPKLLSNLECDALVRRAEALGFVESDNRAWTIDDPYGAQKLYATKLKSALPIVYRLVGGDGDDGSSASNYTVAGLNETLSIERYTTENANFYHQWTTDVNTIAPMLLARIYLGKSGNGDGEDDVPTTASAEREQIRLLSPNGEELAQISLERGQLLVYPNGFQLEYANAPTSHEAHHSLTVRVLFR